MRGILALLVLLLLASCAPRTDEQSGERREARTPAPEAPVARVAVAEEPDQLVPPLARSRSSAAIWPWILPSLVRVETDSTGSGRFVGDVASSWRIEDGGRTARFELDPGRLWEDTTAVDAADVVESYRLYRDRQLGGSWPERLGEIKAVEADPGDGGGVVLRFCCPLAHERILQLASLPLISADQWSRTRNRRPALGTPARPVLAAGPFRVTEWKKGQYLVLERHPFPPPGRIPRADRIRLHFVRSGRGRALQYELGVVELATDLPVEEVERLGKGPLRGGLVRTGAVQAEMLVWNLEDPDWGSPERRRTIRDALDPVRFREALGGSGRIMTSERRFPVLPPFSEPPASDPASVRPAGEPPEPRADLNKLPPLGILYDAADPQREAAAVEIVLQLESCGGIGRLVPRSAGECAARIGDRRFQAVLVGWAVPPLREIGEIVHSAGIYNFAGLRDGRVDSLVAIARSAAADTIPDIWDRVGERVSELSPCLCLGRSVRHDGIDPRIGDYHPDPYEPYGNLLQVAALPPARSVPPAIRPISP